MTTDNSLIKLEGITKVFYTDEVETHALSGIHLDIKKGEYVSIAGPSGCGKSTLLSIVGLLDSPSEGFYTLNGQPVANLGHSEKVTSPMPSVRAATAERNETGFFIQSRTPKRRSWRRFPSQPRRNLGRGFTTYLSFFRLKDSPA